MAAVSEKLSSLEAKRDDAVRQLEQAKNFDPSVQAENIKNALNAYQSSDAATKNALLHSVINHIVYSKEKKSKPMDFKLSFYLK